MSEHPSTGPTAPATERLPVDPPQVSSPATEVIGVPDQGVPTAAAPTAAAPTAAAPTAVAPMHPSDAAYLPAATPSATPLPGEPGHGRPYVTIVLPCFNEGEHVLQEIDRITAAMNASEFTYEVLCIDDASTDDTLEVLQDAATRYANIRVMPFRRNGGSGTARRIGTQQAYGEIVVWTDADMTYENERIPDLVRILRDDPSYDQVVGARTTEEGTHKWARIPAKWLIRKIAEQLSNQTIPDLNSGLRAFRREVSLPYLRLLPPGFSCVTTITLAFLSNQHDIKYVPTSYAKRAGVSKFHFVRDAYRYILQVLRMIMYFDPLKVLMPPALWLIVIGVVKAVVDMVRHPFYFPASTVLLIVSGIMIGSLALLSDLVVRSRTGV
ncbi:glycosyltransferase involved in cell wall biosynthesis [Phycicoccus badiiscoriae]|uniref:Glycosyltransferase involved in cell wall biosynthesis n=1 Tax=Pedococcus badiiscoriae TaxID=642776 RepID=A0A852WN59_9MICO|nr:glycosyltransferase family 2 protein [Pedococcus badiiscoriae]NYG07665.1 glycosyltransferase involved in cell wall biosynthesis [Pedococcus badiiscoriae]